MRSLVLLYMALLLVGASPIGVAAQSPPLTIREAVDEALANNPDLGVLRAQIGVARERPAQERGLTPPMVSAQIWQWPITSLNPANTNMYMFMVGQELPGRGKRDLRAAVADKDRALVAADVTIRERQVIDDVKQTYAALFIARRAAAVYRTGIDLLRQMADVSQAKYITGRISQQDVLKPIVESSRLYNDALVFDEQANLAAARLNVLLGRAPDAPIGGLAEPVEERLLPSAADLQRLAVDREPELARARLEVEKAQAELASARQEYRPDFTVQGGYAVMPNDTDAWLGTVSITWPRAPWSRGRIDARVAELSAGVETARLRVRAMENSVKQSVQAAYVHAASAEARATLLRTTILPQSEQMLAVSRVGYQADHVDFEALIDNERTLIGAQLDYVRALSEFAQATADLERAIGVDLPAGTTAAVDVKEGN